MFVHRIVSSFNLVFLYVTLVHGPSGPPFITTKTLMRVNLPLIDNVGMFHLAFVVGQRVYFFFFFFRFAHVVGGEGECKWFYSSDFWKEV